MDLNVDLISTYSIAVPTLLAILFYFRLSGILKILCWLILATCVIEIIALSMFRLNLNNMFLFHLYSFIEFALISLIYYQLVNDVNWKKIIISAFVLFQVFSAFTFIYFEDSDSFNSIQRNAEGVLLMIYFFAFIRQYSQFERRKRNLFKAVYRLTYGFFIYFSGTLLLFFFANEILNDPENDYWVVHGIFNVFLNLTYTVTILTSLRTKRTA